MVKRRMRMAVPVVLSVLSIGCGKGLTVNLDASPDPAFPGQAVQWNLSVRNDSPCETTAEATNLPDPFPDAVGAFALILGFIPELEEFGPAEFCREFMSTMTACSDEACVAAHFQEAFGAKVTSALTAQAHAAIEQAKGGPQEAGACITLFNDTSGFAALCGFDPLSPGETDTATHNDIAPNSGNTHAAQVAIAFAPATGEDCRPGTLIEGDQWVLAGCFPTAVVRPTPALSPIATAVGAVLLLLTGALGLRRIRRA